MLHFGKRDGDTQKMALELSNWTIGLLIFVIGVLPLFALLPLFKSPGAKRS